MTGRSIGSAVRLVEALDRSEPPATGIAGIERVVSRYHTAAEREFAGIELPLHLAAIGRQSPHDPGHVERTSLDRGRGAGGASALRAVRVDRSRRGGDASPARSSAIGARHLRWVRSHQTATTTITMTIRTARLT